MGWSRPSHAEEILDGAHLGRLGERLARILAQSPRSSVQREEVQRIADLALPRGEELLVDVVHSRIALHLQRKRDVAGEYGALTGFVRYVTEPVLLSDRLLLNRDTHRIVH